MKFKKLTFQQTIVAPSDTTIDQLIKKINKLDGLKGNFKITLENQNFYHWASAECQWKNLSFNMFISACPIENGSSKNELDAIHSKNGETDTYLLKILSIQSKEEIDEELLKETINDLFKKMLIASESVPFKGFYMKKDYIS